MERFDQNGVQKYIQRVTGQASFYVLLFDWEESTVLPLLCLADRIVMARGEQYSELQPAGFKVLRRDHDTMRVVGALGDRQPQPAAGGVD